MKEINYDMLFKWICVFISLFINVSFVYIAVNSILIPIYLYGIPITFFSSFCILIVIETALFLIALPTGAKKQMKDIIVQTFNEQKGGSIVSQYISVNTFYYIVKTVIDLIHLFVIFLIAFFV